jgi:hypothetical protein
MNRATGAIIILQTFDLFKKIDTHCTTHAHASRSTAAARRRCIFVVCIRCTVRYMFINSISKAAKESKPCITAPRLPNFLCSLPCAFLTRWFYVPPPPAAAARRCFLLTRLFFVCGIFAALFFASECRFVARSLARGFLIARQSCAARAHAGCSASTAHILACLQGDRKKHLAPFGWG